MGFFYINRFTILYFLITKKIYLGLWHHRNTTSLWEQKRTSSILGWHCSARLPSYVVLLHRKYDRLWFWTLQTNTSWKIGQAPKWSFFSLLQRQTAFCPGILGSLLYIFSWSYKKLKYFKILITLLLSYTVTKKCSI